MTKIIKKTTEIKQKINKTRIKKKKERKQGKKGSRKQASKTNEG